MGRRRRSILRTSSASSLRRSYGGRCLSETGDVSSFWDGSIREESVCLDEEEDKVEESVAVVPLGCLTASSAIFFFFFV